MISLTVLYVHTSSSSSSAASKGLWVGEEEEEEEEGKMEDRSWVSSSSWRGESDRKAAIF